MYSNYTSLPVRTGFERVRTGMHQGSKSQQEYRECQMPAGSNGFERVRNCSRVIAIADDWMHPCLVSRLACESLAAALPHAADHSRQPRRHSAILGFGTFQKIKSLFYCIVDHLLIRIDSGMKFCIYSLMSDDA